MLVEKRITHALKERGYKLTPARLLLIQIIAESHEHLTPAEIYEKAKERDPDVSLVTVYRTLDVLTRLGFICEVYTANHARSYLIKGPVEHHHHLICSGCGTVLDFTDCDLSLIEEKLRRKTGFHIDSHLLEFSGKCQVCQKKASQDE